jgi:hypothetical protein
MKRCILGALAAVLMTAALITSAPPAGAGCWYGGPVISKCDGPVQANGTWQRCVAVPRLILSGLSSHLVPEKRCGVMGPGLPALDASFADPPTRIAD